MAAAEGPERQRVGIAISAKTADPLKLCWGVLRTGRLRTGPIPPRTSGMTRPSYPTTEPRRMPRSVGRRAVAPDAPWPSRSATSRWMTSGRSQRAARTRPTTCNRCSTPATWPRGSSYKPASWQSLDGRGRSSDTFRKSDHIRQIHVQTRRVAIRADNPPTAACVSAIQARGERTHDMPGADAAMMRSAFFRPIRVPE